MPKHESNTRSDIRVVTLNNLLQAYHINEEADKLTNELMRAS